MVSSHTATSTLVKNAEEIVMQAVTGRKYEQT